MATDSGGTGGEVQGGPEIAPGPWQHCGLATRRRTRLLSAGLAASVLGATLASPVAACLSGYSPAELFQQADVVVTGVAVDRHVGNAAEAVLVLLGNEPPSDVAYDIAVDRIEKGDSHVRERGRVTLHLDGISSCAQHLEMGHRYRLGATQESIGLVVPFLAIEELALLPGPQPTPALTGDAVRVTSLDLLPIVAVLVVLLLVMAGLGLAWGRLRPRRSRGSEP